MKKEDYRILKEINSLNNDRKNSQDLIDSQLHRVKEIERQRTIRTTKKQSTEDELSECRSSLNLIENKMAQIGPLLNQSKSNIANVFSQLEIDSLQAQIGRHKSELDKHETSGLELMEKIEELEIEIQNADTFLAGSLEAIEEISADVIAENQPTIKRIENLENRINLLYEDLPKKISDTIMGLIQQNLKHGPFTSLAGNQCKLCGFTVPMIKVEDIENRLSFNQCRGCRRVYIPETSLY